MNFKILEPGGQARLVGKIVAVALVVTVGGAGIGAVLGFLTDPGGFGQRRTENAQASAVVNGQQAASNAAGAAITDRRASNVARINNTVQEARHALWQEDDLDAALRGYLTDLDRVRDQGRAPVAHDRPDEERPAGDAGSGQAGDPEPETGRQP